MTQTVDLLFNHAAEIATALPHKKGGLRLIEDGTLAVDQGRIVAVGPSASYAQVFTGRETIDCSGKTVTAGLVDPHTHLVFAGERSAEFEQRIAGADYVEISKAGGGILSTMRAVRAASEDELLALGRERIRVLAAKGVTSVEIKSGYGLTIEDELKQLRVARRLGREGPLTVRTTFLGAHAVPPEYKDRRDDYVDLVAGPMTEAVAKEKLADYCDCFCEEGFFSVEECRRVLQAGQRRGLSPKLHADEIKPSGGAELAGELGAASADHLVAVSEAGIGAMVAAAVVPVLLPATTLFLAKSAFAPARRMLEAGLHVALATDWNPGTSWCASQQAVMVLAATRMGMSPAECLAGTTLNAARAIGLGNEAGALDTGRPADLVVWNVPSHRHLCYRLGDVVADRVYRNGRLIAERGRAVC